MDLSALRVDITYLQIAVACSSFLNSKCSFPRQRFIKSACSKKLAMRKIDSNKIRTWTCQKETIFLHVWHIRTKNSGRVLRTLSEVIRSNTVVFSNVGSCV